MNESIEEQIRDLSDSIRRLEILVEDDHRMIKNMHFAYRFSTLFTVLKFVVIIGVTLGAFYFVQPYLEGVLKLYGNVNSLTGGIENNGGIDILKKLNGSQ